jgi:N-acetylmuramic acid 6-phosphate etherase
MHLKCECGYTSRSTLDSDEQRPPTFSAPPGQFISLIAGGDHAIRNAVEDAEDSEQAGAMDLLDLEPPVNEKDVVVGIASSGRTPYVIGGLKHAQFVGAATIGLACVKPSALGFCCGIAIECVTGPEVVTGSTRLKAGTATKMVCFLFRRILRQSLANTSTDTEHDFDGRPNQGWKDIWQHGQLPISRKSSESMLTVVQMVDLKMSNEKLRDRARRVVRAIVPSTSVLDVTDDEILDRILANCDGQVKLSILMATVGCSVKEAKARLELASGSLRKAV